MVNIVCLKFGTKYNADYVNKLYRAVVRNTTVPFTFHCFTEDSSGVDPNIVIQPLPENVPGGGWWYKLYMFEGDKNIGGRIVFFDLDTLIVGNIDTLLQDTHKFTVVRDLFLAQNRQSRDGWGPGRESVQSCFMMWNAGELNHIWDNFKNSDAEAIVRRIQPHGDQKWIQEQTNPKERSYFQDLYPTQVVSYKVHCRKGLPKTARVVCYHGAPSIPESFTVITRVQGMVLKPAPWVKDHWK